MKHILVIGGHSSDATDIAEVTAFAEGVAASAEAMVAIAHIDDIQWSISPQAFNVFNGAAKQSLDTYDIIILRNKMRTYHNVAYALSRYCRIRNKTFFNDYSAYFPATKLAQAIVFYEQAVPFLHTVYAADHQMLRQAITDHLSFPCILKDSKGAKGASNYLVHDQVELDTILARDSAVDFIAQEYCPNTCDYRILILGEHQLVIKRSASGDSHLNNTTLGAAAHIEPETVLPAEILLQSRQLMNVLQLTIAGVDVMPRKDTDSFYFLETNAQPQIFTGTFLPEKQALFAAMLADLSV